MKRNKIFSLFFFVMVFGLTSCKHKHEYSQLIEEVPATCEVDGVIAHYTCDGCEELFDKDKNVVTTLVIPHLGHDYVKHVAVDATLTSDGVKEYYSCSRCNKIFVKVGDAYNETTQDNLVVSQLVGEVVEAKEPTFLEKGNIEYVLVSGETNRYFVLREHKYVEVALADVEIAKKQLNAEKVELNEASPLAFDLNEATEQSILAAIVFDVEDTEGVKYQLNATKIVDYAPIPGQHREFVFQYGNEGEVLFSKTLSLDLYYAKYEIAEPGHKFADGDQILFVNANSRAMANWLSYAGYTSGSSGSTKIALSEKMDNDLYRYASITGVEDVLVLKLSASKSVEGTFYVEGDDGKLLCGGMGYTQWIPFSNNNSLAQSFELTVKEDYTAVVHGQQYTYSYLRIWNRYGEGLDAFFITNTADYGDNYYIYVLNKDYTGCAHEFGELITKVDADCEHDGVKEHYICSQCGKAFDANKNPLESTVIPQLGHDYVKHDLVPATPENAGVKEYYSCTRCSDIFLLEDGKYVKVSEQDIIIPQLEAKFVEEVKADFEHAGIIAHYELSYNGVTTYLVKVNDQFIEKTLDELVIARKEYSGAEVSVAPESKLEYNVTNLTEKEVLKNVVFDVIASDDSSVKVNATKIENFDDAKIGQGLTYKFVYEIDGIETFSKEVTIDVYENKYQLVIDASQLKDGDVIVLGNINTRIMANFLSYAGYKAGSSGTTLVLGENKLDEGMYEHLITGDNSEALYLTLKASAEVEGAFYIVRPDNKYLCGGMGYTQWLDYSEANGLPMSFTITINDSYVSTIHGNKFNYSYLRVWNRYANADDAFFITNSATYGDNIYVYKEVKSYEEFNTQENLIHVDAVAATCTSKGNVEYYHNPRNGKNYDAEGNKLNTVETEMAEHSYSQLHEYVAPTDETDGHIAYYECEVCHQLFDENHNIVTDVSIPRLGHVLSELKKAKEADCIHDGNVAYYECARCHQLFDENMNKIDSATIKALGHVYGDLLPAVPATCTEFGTVAHYECATCGKCFDTNYNRITNAYVEMHTYNENGVCSVCGFKKALTVSEAKQVRDATQLITVRGVIVGVTGNYDGGYVYVLIKDLTTNEIAGIRKQVVGDNLDGEERLIGYGSSYAPKMYFTPGDVVELPISVVINKATKGGETAKIIFVYRGVGFSSENSKELVAQYKVGEVEDYRLNLEETVTVIEDQELLEEFCLSSQPQYKLVCIKGTEEHPLKIVTHSATTAGVGDISREYLYLFYDNAKSLTEVRVNGAAPVFANFGNQFNLKAMLSSILFGQSEYEDYQWDNPYTFVGEIYCIMNGGSTSYYHFVVLNNGDIFNESFTGPIPVTAKVACNTFYDYQEANLEAMNIERGRDINSAVGVTGVVCCEDMVKFGVLATQNESLANIWSKEEYSTSYTDGEGRKINITVNHAVLELEQCNKWIKPNYTIIGSKSGWLNYTSDTRPYYVCNCLVAVEGPDGTTMVGYVYNKRGDNGDDSVYYYLNILYQILLNLREGKDISTLEAQLNCDSCAGVIIPKGEITPDDADFFSEASTYINYTKNAKELITTASTWKTFTGLTCCRYFTEEQLDMQITVLESDLNSIGSVPNFKGGEVITLRDALHFMMLPSSNICPSIIARIIGTELAQQEMAAN